jgi:hypothetical protein
MAVDEGGFQTIYVAWQITDGRHMKKAVTNTQPPLIVGFSDPSAM